MHLLVLCEGDLEKKVLETFLCPFWEKRFKSVEIQNYSGSGELKQKFKGDTETQLSEEPKSCVVCLVDLYKEPFGVYDKNKMDAAEGFKVVQEYMTRQIQTRFHPRFGAFPLVMELETWLLADEVVQRHLIISPIAQPEYVPHPTAYLKEIYKGRNNQYGKILNGVELFRKADARRVYRDTCPHFNLLADWLTTPQTAIQLPSPLKEKILKWEEIETKKYERWQELEARALTIDDLDLAIQAEEDYNHHLKTWSELFKSE